MLIDDEVFKSQFLRIDHNKQNKVNWKYKSVFIDGNNDFIPTANTLRLTKISKFNSAIADYFIVTLQVYKSVYFKLLKTNYKLLRLQLTRTPTSVTGTVARIGTSYIEYYNAYVIENTSEAVETRSGGLTGTHLDDLGELIEINVQLIETGLDEFRKWDVGGVYRNVKMDTLLKGLMSHPINALSDTETKGYNVSLYQPDNNERYFQRLIPNGVKLINLPDWLQKKWGIYASGLGYYLQQGMWYIYPLADFSRYEKSTKRLTIINIPKNEMMGITNSYVLENEELCIFATGDTKHVDETARGLEDTGTGFRAAKSGNLMTQFSVSKKGETIIPKGRNLMTVSFDNSENKLENIKTGSKLFTSNPWNESSKVINNMGNIISLLWEYSNPNLLYPGMPVRFIYKYNKKPYSLYGILVGIKTEIKTHLQSVTDNQYVSNSQLTLFTEKAKN
jgi:hypothetical protein